MQSADAFVRLPSLVRSVAIPQFWSWLSKYGCVFRISAPSFESRPAEEEGKQAESRYKQFDAPLPFMKLQT
jgi:hypothetical protein